MNHLYAAANIIQASALAEIGVSLFVGTMPSDIKRGVMLKEPLYGANLDPALGTFVQHQFQVIVRDDDTRAAWDLCFAIGESLKVDNHTDDGVEILKMYPLTLPAVYPKMDSDELETSLRMRIAFALV